MNNKTYLSVILAACMGVVSAPLWAEVPVLHPANNTAPSSVSTEEHATHQKAMEKHYKPLS